MAKDTQPVELTGSNVTLPTAEQSAYDFVFVPPRQGSNVILTNMTINRFATLFDGFSQITSSTAGATCKFRFRGRRIGVLLTKFSAYGMLAFDVDGTDYGTYDCSQIASGASNIVSNLPHVIATDLPDTEHVLTITKLDANSTSIQGFLVDNASTSQIFTRVGYNFHEMMDGALAGPVNIGTSDTSIRTTDIWAHSITLTNTTASPINVTLKSNTATIMGPFPVPANDIRQIQGPIFFSAAMKAVASATGVFMTMGGQ